jgi:hypothetical protein
LKGHPIPLDYNTPAIDETARRPGQAKREQGPITTGLRFCEGWGGYLI